ncbi:MAG: thiamine pyrophosphate-dependent enzyme [Bacteroidota bacterium]
MDVIVVSDIGCCGLIDPLLTCHTIHGLHGRVTALAMGVAIGVNNPGKKVIAIQGDGGVTIGLQHLMEAARLNVNLSLIVHNNMVYGMTGGQISGLSTCEFKTEKMPEESNIPPYDICELAHKAGASYSSRVVAQGSLNQKLTEVFGTKGFSLLEIWGLCPSYAYKKIKDIINLPCNERTLENQKDQYQLHIKNSPSLFKDLTQIEHRFESSLKQRVQIVIAGSAGGGVQVAADLLAFAGIASGLNTTKKGEYPITVGTGFSVAEIVFSRDEIYYTGIEKPDVAIIVTQDGLDKIKNRIGKDTILVMDEGLDIPGRSEPSLKADFRRISGKKGAVISAIAFWLKHSNLFPVEALKFAAKTKKFADILIKAIEHIENDSSET